MVIEKFKQIATDLCSPAGRRIVNRALHAKLYPFTYPIGWAWRRGPLNSTKVIAVNGSFGKTSTVKCISHVLGGRPQSGIESNFASYLVRILLATPIGSAHTVIEIGINKPGDMQKHARLLKPDVAVVTCVGHEHHSNIGDLEAIRAEKAHLLKGLSSASLAVLNGDDANVLWMADQTKARVITYGFEAHNSVRATGFEHHWPQGTALTVKLHGKEYNFFSPLIGKPAIYNTLAAVALASDMEISPVDIQKGLNNLKPVDGRMQPVQLSNGAMILRDDFKSSLETYYTALEYFVSLKAPRKLAVLGDIMEPPKPQRKYYRKLGAIIADNIDRVYYMGNMMQPVRSEAQKNGMKREQMLDCGKDLNEAVRLLRSELQPGDVVLIKGRNNQKLERISLILEGTEVKCRKYICRLPVQKCRTCPELLTPSG